MPDISAEGFQAWLDDHKLRVLGYYSRGALLLWHKELEAPLWLVDASDPTLRQNVVDNIARQRADLAARAMRPRAGDRAP